MTRFYLIRHAETDFNRQKRYCGRTDLSLNRAGEEQAKKLRERFNGISVDAVCSSDLKRAQQTAQIAFPDHRGTVTASALLRELDFGQWEGLTYEEILARDEELYRAWLEDPASSAPPGGESLSDLNHRVKSFLERILKELGSKVIAVVTHGGLIRMLLCHAIEIPLSAIWRIAVDSASVSILDFHKTGPCVRLMNDTCHLRSLEGEQRE